MLFFSKCQEISFEIKNKKAKKKAVRRRKKINNYLIIIQRSSHCRKSGLCFRIHLATFTVSKNSEKKKTECTAAAKKNRQKSDALH